MDVIPFGTNGFFASMGRQTACYVIARDDVLIILDAGSGFFRFGEEKGQELLKKAKSIHIYLSHYHLDHTFGFYAAFRLLENKKVDVFGYQDRQVFSELVNINYFPVDYSKVYKNFTWHKIGEGTHDTHNYKIQVQNQNHRGECSLAFRFDFGLSYVTDGEPSEKIVEFVKNSKILLCEGEGVGMDKKLEFNEQIIGGHITSTGAALIAKKAKVEKLILIHHNPFDNHKILNNKLRIVQKIFPNTFLANDFENICF
jgi:ribonuclease BN (tRNA processing enzyme)